MRRPETLQSARGAAERTKEIILRFSAGSSRILRQNLRRDTEAVVTGSTRNRFEGQKLSRGFESPSLRQKKAKRRLKNQGLERENPFPASDSCLDC
jgi:hypothetical protein